MRGLGSGVGGGSSNVPQGVQRGCWGLREGEGARALLERVRGGGTGAMGQRGLRTALRGAGVATEYAKQGMEWRTERMEAGDGVHLSISTFNMLCPLFKRVGSRVRPAALD